MMMKELVADFPKQLQKALLIAQSADLKKSNNTIQNVFISGLGGSGIGGSIVAELVSQEAKCPITINKDYFSPSFINENTLAIICTYSGNTEETIQVLKHCVEARAKITVITSGGDAANLAEQHHIDYILLPAGFPPRSCIGYSICQILKVLHFHKITEVNHLPEVENTIALLENQRPQILTEAEKVAHAIYNKMLIIYTLGNTEGVAIRFRQQLNENSKMLCWHHVLPEMNHNELVGWTAHNENLAVVIFRYENDYYRTIKRLEVCKEVFAKYCNTIIEIQAQGSSPVQRALYMIHLGDWISCLIADIKQVDAIDISIINHLKSELSKMQ
jgi:glucose/mannose-6-phosphate isomerase